MGMFDDIRCEHPLPLPADQGELAGKDWTKHGFQTKDLGQGMGAYCVRADGKLWLVGAAWLRDDLAEEQLQEHFFGTVEFYDTVYGQKHDYRVRWKATFAEGKLKDLCLNEWRLEDNTERLHQEAERKAKKDRTDRFLRTWAGRFIYPAYAWITGMILNGFVADGFYRLSNAFSRLRTIAWKLAGRLTPHGDPIGAKRRERARKSLLEE
jgi:hypothetical protein